MKVKLVVEAELAKGDILDPDTIPEDLIGELVKIKSGPYENMFYGEITSVDLSSKVREVQRA